MLTAALTALSPLAGCVSQDQIDAQQAVYDYHTGAYCKARQLLEPLAKKTNEDFALNNCRLGSTALGLYDLNTGQTAFLSAYEVLNSFGVNNGGRTLGAVLVDERLKIWRGEPFERAMACYYLGLIYYMQHDYNNARGAFENALFKLRDYQADGDDKEIQADKYKELDSNFVLAQYMLARCQQRLGDDDQAKAAFARTVALRPELASLADINTNARSNVLLMIDLGDGPRKVATDDGELIGFVPDPREVGATPVPSIYIDGQWAQAEARSIALVDLIALAQDRRWQSIDTIRAVKSAIGTGLIVGGAYEAVAGRHVENLEVGLALLAAGLIFRASSQADTRSWEMLPRCTYAIPMQLTPGKHDVQIDFPAAGLRQTWHGLDVPAQGEATYYFRVRYDAAPQSWPPATLTGWPSAITPAPPAPANRDDLPEPP